MDTGTASKTYPDARALTQRWFDEVWNKGMAETIDELLPETSIMWGANRPESKSVGPGKFKEFYKSLRSACPDIQVTMEQIVQEGDSACARWVSTMTHTGAGLNIPPTNRHITIHGMSACKVQEGKIIEAWDNWDQIGMARQLGVLQGPAATLFQ